LFRVRDNTLEAWRDQKGQRTSNEEEVLGDFPRWIIANDVEKMTIERARLQNFYGSLTREGVGPEAKPSKNAVPILLYFKI